MTTPSGNSEGRPAGGRRNSLPVSYTHLDVYKRQMFPGVDAFLKERNPPEGYILVTPIPGLLDDDFDSEREEE